MTRKTFNTCFAALAKAYLYSESKIDPETADVYWEMLQAIPDEKFTSGVRYCLATSKFFPTIAELGEASLPTLLESHYNGRYYVEPEKIDWHRQLSRMEELPRVEKRKRISQ